MVVRDDEGKYAGLGCDMCGTMAPGTKEIIAGFGLTNMGWYCSGGTHICPACPHPERYVAPVRREKVL